MINELISGVVRASAVLTNAYVASAGILTQTGNQINFLVDFTKGSLDRIDLKIEYSEDKQNWFQESMFAQVVISGSGFEYGPLHVGSVRKLSTTCKLIICVPVSASWCRISAIGIGTVTNSLLAITAVVNRV